MPKTPGWTVDTLKEHFERILVEKDKALNAALASSKEQVSVAEKNAEKWRDNANEWRAAMTDREKTFMRISEFNIYKDSAEKALQAEKGRGDKSEGKQSGINQFVGWLVAAAAISGFLLEHFKK